MSLPYYVHEDDADQYDLYTEEIGIIYKEADEKIVKIEEHYFPLIKQVKEKYKINDLRVLVMGQQPDPTELHKYYIYCSTRGRLPGRHPEPKGDE